MVLPQPFDWRMGDLDAVIVTRLTAHIHNQSFDTMLRSFQQLSPLALRPSFVHVGCLEFAFSVASGSCVGS